MNPIHNAFVHVFPLGFSIIIIPVYSDNYTYLILQGTEATAVDPGDANAVQGELKRRGVSLTHILCTHHHFDHVGGVSSLKSATGCTVIGPVDRRIPSLDQGLSEGDRLTVGSFMAEAVSVPGHTKTHLVYHFPSANVLFSGDCLFLGGCGRIFEGTAAEMYASLKKLASLPDDTLIFCGHEYTEENLRFACSLEPENAAVSSRLRKVGGLRRKSLPSVPGTLWEEKLTNPFLRVHEQTLRSALRMEGAADWEVFGAIRRLKDRY
jgi:hydroxyacylglutathione hydrolase